MVNAVNTVMKVTTVNTVKTVNMVNTVKKPISDGGGTEGNKWDWWDGIEISGRGYALSTFRANKANSVNRLIGSIQSIQG